MTDLAIDLLGVDKRYRGTLFRKGIHALRGVNMRVDRGAVFGLLGPNGAGKSTLVKILMTVISPTRAEGTVLGEQVGHKGTLARVGYLPEHHKFPDYLTGAQIVDHFGALCGTPRSERRRRSGELLELVGMSKWASTRVRNYSKGMRQRIGIAQALINDPDLVVLDEPTDGVDPVGRRDIRNICIELKRRGKTVFLNSHLLSELEMVCDRVAIMVKGLVVSQGTIDELTVARQRYEIELASPPAEGAGGSLLSLPAERRQDGPRTYFTGRLLTGEEFEIEQSTIRVRTTEAERVQPVLDQLRAGGAIIRSFRPIRPTLEDLFMEAVIDRETGKTLTPGAADEPTRRKGGEG